MEKNESKDKKSKRIKYLLIAILPYACCKIADISINTYFGRYGILHILFTLLSSFFLCLPIFLIASFIICIIFTTLLEKIFKTEYGKISKLFVSIGTCFLCIVLLSFTSPWGLRCYHLYLGGAHPFASHFIYCYYAISDLIIKDTVTIYPESYTIYDDAETRSGIKYNSGKSTIYRTYIMPNGYYRIPITDKDRQLLINLLNREEGNSMIIYKKSGIIAGVNGKSF